MTRLEHIKDAIMQGKILNKEEANAISKMPLDALADQANEIRRFFCGNSFDLCTIINAKSGKCSEDCKFCTQSVHYQTKTQEYELLKIEELLKEAKDNEKQGVMRYSMVTSGKRLNNHEINEICNSIQTIKKETSLSLCSSFGLLDEKQFKKIKAAGISRIHNNLETSERNFKNICTSHTFEDKIKTIKAAQKAGLIVCSGGIIGLGENMEDRIDMAIQIRELGIRSIPVNILNPIKGTPYAKNEMITSDEIRRSIALFRFIIPWAYIRLAGGRGLLPDKGKQCFLSGANAAITGDMLTTAGVSIKTDMEMITKIGYKVNEQNE